MMTTTANVRFTINFVKKEITGSKASFKKAGNQFKNLKYENMEGFMSVLPRAEEYLAQYNFLKYYAGLVQTNAYTLVRRWFVAQFPEFRKNPIFYLNNDVPVISAMTIIQEVEAEREEREQEAKAA